METTDAFTGLECLDCGASFDAADEPGRCPDCGGVLDPTYDYDALDLTRNSFARDPIRAGRAGIWRYEAVLPFPREAAVTMDEGGTPLVEAPRLAEELGVGRVLVKDEGRNPTGVAADRGAAVAVSAAAQHGATDVAMASPGNDGQAVAAYAARGGMDSHTFVPSRASFVNKAMINVHGGDMYVVEGRIDDAIEAYEDVQAERDDYYALQRFVTPYRHEGRKTVYYELLEQLEWELPDAVVCPTGEGVGLVGVHKAARECRDLGLVDDVPPLYAAQSDGCAPIVEAFDEGRDEAEPVEYPDTICGDLEIPEPARSDLVLDALRDTGGGAVAADDQDIMDTAATIALHEGLEASVASAAAAAGAWELSQDETFGEDDTIVLLGAGAGNKDADTIRSRLMAKGM
ncbi:threonine synthase [Haloglomus litoreum]|uniref:threonine synthase n=1 Tax=Haloglomus litoreum TaxID=3034026 RepID=UPI0023E7885A|nr:threonine synthase [Haloglomus sp. DT116]